MPDMAPWSVVNEDESTQCDSSDTDEGADDGGPDRGADHAAEFRGEGGKPQEDDDERESEGEWVGGVDGLAMVGEVQLAIVARSSM